MKLFRQVVFRALLALLGSTGASRADVYVLPPAKTVVGIGEPVSFSLTANYQLVHNAQSIDGLSEPGPGFWGMQEWYRGGYWTENEVSSTLHMMFNASDGQQGALAVDMGQATFLSHSFSLSFAQAGTYQVYSAAWTNTDLALYTYRSADQRECYFFICGAWQTAWVQESTSHQPSGRDLGSRSFAITVVPEPASLTLMCLGLLGLAGFRRQHQRRSELRTTCTPVEASQP